MSAIVGPVGAESVIRRSWTSEEYHAHPAISRSKIVTVLARPELYFGRHEAKTIQEEEGEAREALRFGTLFHLRVLEPERWEKEVVIAPRDLPSGVTKPMFLALVQLAANGGWADVALEPEGYDWRTKAGKAWKAEAQSQGKRIVGRQLADLVLDTIGHRRGPLQILTARDAALIEAMAESLTRAPAHDDVSRRLVQAALRKGEREVAYTWRDHVTGLECKALLDLPRLDCDRPVIWDLKSTGKDTVDGLAWSIRQYGYHVQAAFYSEPVRLATGKEPIFRFAFVLKDPPHEVIVVELDDEMIADGREAVRRGLDEIYMRRQSGDWQAPWTKRPIKVGRRGVIR